MSDFSEQSENSKEEILAKSRRSKKDEGMEHATLKGNKLGEITMAIVAIPMLAFAILCGELAVFFAVGGSIAAFTFGQCLMEYRFTKRKYHLVWTIFTAAATIICLGLFVAVSLGWWDKSHFLGWLL